MPWQVVPEVPRLAEGDVQVWWASPGDVAPWMRELFDDVERRRHDQLRRQEDRDRFVVGCALLKRAAAAQTGAGAEAIRLVRARARTAGGRTGSRGCRGRGWSCRCRTPASAWWRPSPAVRRSAWT